MGLLDPLLAPYPSPSGQAEAVTIQRQERCGWISEKSSGSKTMWGKDGLASVAQ